MFDELLKFIVKNKVYVEVYGMMEAGMDKILLEENGLYFLGRKRIVFTGNMIKELNFHERGCTIIMKGNK